MQRQLLKALKSDDGITVAALAETPEPQNRGQITALAHALWQARGCPDGTPDEDWFQADQKIVESMRMEEQEVKCRDYTHEC